MCYYCKWKGHVKTECPALAKKTRQNAIVAPPKLKYVDLNPDVMGQEKMPDVYGRFCVAWDDIPCWLCRRETIYNIKRYGGIPVSRARECLTLFR